MMITWGIYKTVEDGNRGEYATVFCTACRKVFNADIPLKQAKEAAKLAEVSQHHCVPQAKWKPSNEYRNKA
jgi:hypothetical protein